MNIKQIDSSHTRGFILLSVVLTLTILATISFMLTRQSAINAGGVVREHHPDITRYIAEAGYNHAIWKLNRLNCNGYSDIATVSLGSHSYNTTITDSNGTVLTAGTPANISSTGTHVNGTSFTLNRNGVKIYQFPLQQVIIQPDPSAGIDTYLYEWQKSRNFGTSTSLWVRNNWANSYAYSFFNFDLDFLPSQSKIVSAVFELWQNTPSSLGGTVGIRQVLNDWVEGTTSGTNGIANWNERETGIPWSTPGGDFISTTSTSTLIQAATIGWHQWDITTLVSNWSQGTLVNQGFSLIPESENTYVEFNSSDHLNPVHRPKLTISYTCECGLPCTIKTTDKIILSTRSNSTLGGLTFDLITLASFDSNSNIATLYFDGSTTTLTGEIDAIHLLENNNLVFSTKDDVIFGGLNFKDGDLVEYDPSTDVARLYFEENTFSNDEDITSVYVMDNGHILLSTASNATLGLLSFTANDLIEYDPTNGTATLYFDGSLVSLTGEIDAVHILENGHIILSTQFDDGLGGLKFKDGDLVDYDPATNTAVLYFDEGLFSNDEDVQSVHIGSANGPGLPPAKKLYWTDDVANKIQRSNEDGSSVEDVITGLDRPTGLDIDATNGKIYWTNNQQIQRANLDGSNVETIYTGSAVTFDIKLDITGGKMYWTHNGTSLVMRADLDGSNSESINTSLSRPSYISLDSNNQHIYLTAFASGTVSRMNFDGSAVTTISLGPAGAVGSAIDLVNGKLFWSGGSTNDWIRRSNLDGTKSESIVTGLNAPQDIVYDADNNRIYWVDALNTLVQRSQSDGSNIENIVSGLTRPRGIVLVNADLVTPTATPANCNGTYRDEFETVSYANNDGTLVWATDWTEINESDGADSGDVMIVSNQDSERLTIKNSNQGIKRGANLTGAVSASLKFDYRTRSLDKTSDYVTVDISTDGGKNWDEIHRFSGPADDTAYFPITFDITDYISPDFTLRFLSSATTGKADYLYFDNIQIECVRKVDSIKYEPLELF